MIKATSPQMIRLSIFLRNCSLFLSGIIFLLSACWVSLAQAKTTSSTLTAGVGLDFGSFAVLPSCSNCTITISPTGVRTASAGIVLTSANPGSAGTYSYAATCNNGPPSGCQAYTTAITPTTVTISAGGVTMTVGNFTTQQSSSIPPNTLSVGATLTIPSSGSTAGTYTSGSFLITTTP